jgi:hypothetical protein
MSDHMIATSLERVGKITAEQAVDSKKLALHDSDKCWLTQNEDVGADDDQNGTTPRCQTRQSTPIQVEADLEEHNSVLDYAHHGSVRPLLARPLLPMEDHLLG